jgi:hypothetical protein
MDRIDVSNLFVVGVVLPLPGSQKVIHDKVGNFAAQALAGSEVEVETVGDCAPGVRTITRSALFHGATGLTC